MASVSVSLIVPVGDGVGAFVDCSGLSPERTITFDGGPFTGSIFLEGTNDAGASVFPIAVGPFTGLNGSPSPQPLLATIQQMRVRRSGTIPPAGTPTVTLSAPPASSNVFADVPVTPGDGAGAGVDVSGGGDINTIGIQGPFSGQVIIEASTDGGATFVGTGLLFGVPSQTTQGSPAAATLPPGAISQVRARRSGSIIGQPLPSVSVGSGSTQGSGVFPGFGTPGNIGPNEPVVGVSALAARADAIPGQKIQAAWPLANVRWYALDGVNGIDTNPGFSDLSSADAGTKAVKTLAALAAIFPRVGANRKVVIVVNATSYAGQGGLDLLLNGCSGYQNDYPLVVATGTNATAGAVAFAGNVNDRTYLGFTTGTGLNAAGYSPTGAATTTSLPCTLFGGGAPAFPAEPAKPYGLRIRFDIGTSTALLQNKCYSIGQVSAGNTLVPLTAMAAAPTAADKFYIEQPACIFDSTILNVPNEASNAIGAQIAGFDFPGTLEINGGQFIFAGCEAGTLSQAGPAYPNYDNLYISDAGTVTCGMGMLVDGNCSVNSSEFNRADSTILTLAIGGALFLEGASNFYWNHGSSVFAGLSLNVSAGEVGPQSGQVTGFLGGRSHIGETPCRIRGTTTASATTAGLLVLGSSVTVDELDIEQAGANPAIALNGKCGLSVSSALVGSTGNTDVGLDLTGSKDSTIVIYSTPTVTGTAGDVRLAGGQIVSWAALAATGIVDSAGNRFISATGPLASVKFSGWITTTNGAASSAYLADTGDQTSIESLQSALRYPTSLRFFTRLRVTSRSDTAGVAVTATLRKNDAATAMQVSIPAGTAANTKFADLAHPILFADGDDYDIRLDGASDAAPGTLFVSASLEGPA